MQERRETEGRSTSKRQRRADGQCPRGQEAQANLLPLIREVGARRSP